MMNDIERNLERYLEVEGLLNTFFDLWGYCISACIRPEILKNRNRPVAGCCKRKYYSYFDLDHPAYARLREEREKRFGKPEDHRWPNPVSPCEYHNPERGCLLTSHKSPVCIAFVCRNGIDHLRYRFGIYTYDYLGFNYALEWLLTGDLPEGQYVEFREGILRMIETLKKSGGS